MEIHCILPLTLWLINPKLFQTQKFKKIGLVANNLVRGVALISAVGRKSSNLLRQIRAEERDF